jgi:hypothetical protein
MSTMVGADAAELERVAHTFRLAADELDDHAASVTAMLRSMVWVGGVATRFESHWAGDHHRRLRSTAASIRTAAADLDRNAAEQRAAGEIGGSSAPRAGNPARVGRALDRLGATEELLGVAGGLAEDLADHGAVNRFVDLLAGENFERFLDGAGHVVDAGTVVVDAVADFADHLALPFDERIVHALSDAAVRLGLSEGMETAAEWLAGAATTALMPGFGAVLAPFAGGLAGVLADTVMGVVVDVVDGATDFVDSAADASVVAYREIKEVFGVVVDLADVAVDLARGAVDLAGDAAAPVLRAGGSAIDHAIHHAIDQGVDLVGSINPFD